MNNLTYVGVSGMFFSGSSAIVDLLKEYSNTFECKAEIRIIKDPYGICELENALVDEWELINSSAAINDYLWLCEKCNRTGTRFPLSPSGLSYKKKLNNDFLKLSYQYVSSLSDFTYLTENYHLKFKKNYFKYIFDRNLWAIEYFSKGKIKTASRYQKLSYFSHPTKELFCEKTKEYFDSIFKKQLDDPTCDYVILDQAVSPNHYEVIHKYFRKAKLIIVLRDPRDMYIDNILWGENKEHNVNSVEAGIRFCKQQLALRSTIKNAVNDKDVLIINFEDLVLDYDLTVLKIEKFLGLSSNQHEMKREFFNPSKSFKNVYLWKKYFTQYNTVLDTIKQEMSEWCYIKKD